MKTCCRPLNKHMRNFGLAVLLWAASATTIDWLWKDRQPRGRTFMRIAVTGALFFNSGIGWMSDVIAFICTSREIRNLHGRHFISPRRIVQCFGVTCSAFGNRQDSSTFDGCRHLTAVSINQSLLLTVMLIKGVYTQNPVVSVRAIYRQQRSRRWFRDFRPYAPNRYGPNICRASELLLRRV